MGLLNPGSPLTTAAGAAPENTSGQQFLLLLLRAFNMAVSGAKPSG